MHRGSCCRGIRRRRSGSIRRGLGRGRGRGAGGMSTIRVLSVAANCAHQVNWFRVQRLCIISGEGHGTRASGCASCCQVKHTSAEALSWCTGPTPRRGWLASESAGSRRSSCSYSHCHTDSSRSCSPDPRSSAQRRRNTTRFWGPATLPPLGEMKSANIPCPWRRCSVMPALHVCGHA
jgi:hypothetical protein